MPAVISVFVDIKPASFILIHIQLHHNCSVLGKSALTTPRPLVVYSTDRSKAVVPLLLFVALWFILRGDLFYALPCVILFLCLSVLLALRLPRFGKRELILVLFGRLFDLCLFDFVGFLFLLVSGRGCDL